MSQKIEKEIQHLLSEGLSTKQVATSLAERALDRRLNNESLVTLCIFIYRIGAWDLLAKLSLQLLKEKQLVAVAPIIKTLMSDSQFDLDKNLVLFIQAASELEQQKSVLQALHNNPSAKVNDLNLEFIESIKQEYEERKTSLLEKLDFFKADDMYEQEHLTLKQIEREFPELENLSKLYEDFKKRWAINLFNNRQSSKEYEILEKPASFTEEELHFIEVLKTEATKAIQKSPELAYDFALLFYFISALDEAIDILNLAPSNYSTEWLQLEWLLEARRFVEAYNLSQILNKKYPDSPENNFAFVYAKARILWGLQNFSQAIDEMQSLVNVRPQYRSAQTLLAKWNGGIA